MPTVLIDLERLKHFNTGLGHLSWNLGRAILDLNPENWSPVLLLPKGSDNLFEGDFEREWVTSKRRHFPRLCPNYDLWHSTHQDSSYLPGSAKTKLILTIADLNFIGEKSAAKTRARLQQLQKRVDRATVITAISDFTRTEVVKHLSVPKDRPIEVVHCGVRVDPGIRPERPKGLPEGDFLFNIGVVRPKKNQHVLLGLLQRAPDYNLIIAGNTDHDYADQLRQAAREMKLDDRVTLTGEVSESEKQWLFQNCKAFLFPSKLEGFGIPVAEAMTHGKPVFTSRLTSLPEVGGDEAFYWDNFEPDHMKDVFVQGIEACSHDSGKSSRLRARASLFTWADAAGKYRLIYEGILGT